MSQDNTVLIEDAKIIFRNFTGKEGQYNREGDRNFGVLLEETVANDMAEDGWNVKWLKPREDAEDETPQAWIQVSVGYKNRPPRVVMVSSGGRTNLNEDSVEMLDWADIEKADLVIRPYSWDVSGKTGIKAYVKTLIVTIEEDPLERRLNAADAESNQEP